MIPAGLARDNARRVALLVAQAKASVARGTAPRINYANLPKRRPVSRVLAEWRL